MPEAKQEHATNAPSRPWTLDIQTQLEALEVSAEEGLTTEAVKQRRKKYGRNRLQQPETKSAGEILLDQFKGIIMALLAAAAILSFAFGNWIDGIAIIVVIVVTVAIGFFTEWSSRRSMAKLQELGATETAVRRNGQAQTIPAEELVPGDILIIDEGTVVTADARLLEANKLQADESALTGESAPVSKSTETLDSETPLAERENMLFKGTAITRGSGEAVVVTTGMETELGQISALVDEAEEEVTPLEKRLDQLGRKLVWVVIGLSAIIVVVGLLTDRELARVVETAVALAVAAVPEGLPIVATVALARGMWRMARRNALVERLTAVETLGSTSIIFSDKTGTLTENQMTVTQIYLADETITVTGEGLDMDGRFRRGDETIDSDSDDLLRAALRAGILCSNASINNTDTEKDEVNAVGEPLEIALLVAGAKAGLDRDALLEQMPEAREVAFDPEIDMMATFHAQDGRYLVAVKGAPEAVLNASTQIRTRDGHQELNEDERETWLQRNDEMAADGLRILAVASKESDSSDAEPYRDLTLLALFGLLDPPREEVRDSINTCQQAGVRTIMVTGDHPETARNVGRAVGLTGSNGEAAVVRGSELKALDELSGDEQERLLQATIFARMSPEQKLNLIDLHQSQNAIVAMTGDGVNDAPALEKADIGVAMGQRGTDVAKDAADMVLQDDAFSSIVAAIEYGRIIFANIRKFTVYLISGNVGEIVAVAIATLTNLPLPLLPLQILYINVLNDVFPSLALGLGGSLPGVMAQPPRNSKEPILTRRHWTAIVLYGLLIGGVVLAALFVALRVLGLDERTAVTISFLTTTFARLWHVINMRSRQGSLLRNEVVSNPFVWGALALCTGLLLLTVYWQPFADLLSLSDPGLNGWLLIGGMSLLPAVLGQIAKALPIEMPSL